VTWSLVQGLLLLQRLGCLPQRYRKSLGVSDRGEGHSAICVENDRGQRDQVTHPVEP
jgi:hypothetical protein